MATADVHVSAVGVLAGSVTRTWVVMENARPFTIQLYHHTVTGSRSMSIDGVEVQGTTGGTAVLSSKAELVFSLGDKKGFVTIEPRGAEYWYTCSFDGAAVVEENQLLHGAEQQKQEALNKLNIKVLGGDVGVDENGSAVVWFRLNTVRESDMHETTVHRRFRDFYAVNEALRSAYKGSHLLSSFPDLPSRSFKFFEDHLSQPFVQKRQWQLQDWVYKISQIPRMRSNPDFLTFLGLIDNVRETSVMFAKNVALGLSLRSGADCVEVAGLKPLDDGAPSPAQMSNMVFTGDRVSQAATLDLCFYTLCPAKPLPGLLLLSCRFHYSQISKINGEDVLGEHHDLVVAKLKSAARPLTVHFLGAFRPKGWEEDSEYSSAQLPTAAAAVVAPPQVARIVDQPPAVIDETDSSKPMTGLIGDGVSYIGTGATPKPAAMTARKGLKHHVDAAKAAATGGNTGIIGVL
jgi:hypothetical protein